MRLESFGSVVSFAESVWVKSTFEIVVPRKLECGKVLIALRNDMKDLVLKRAQFLAR